MREVNQKILMILPVESAGFSLPKSAKRGPLALSQGGGNMKVGYVVLYVQDPEASLQFWTRKIGLVVKDSKDAGGFKINQVGFPDQDFSFELVPLKLMEQQKDHGLNLGTPSIAFKTPDLHGLHKQLVDRKVQTTEISNHFGIESFAFSDNAGNWFAALQ